MKTIEAAQGQWEYIFSSFGLPAPNPRKHVDCLVCGKTQKLRIDDKDGSGSWVCVCGAGYGIDLVQAVTGMDFKTAAAKIDELIGNVHEKEERVKKDFRARDKALYLFGQAKNIRGTDGEVYLNSRGLFDMPRAGVKWGMVHNKPCLIAIASTELREPRQMHTTFIKDGQKIEGTARKMFSLAPKSSDDQDIAEPISVKLFDSGTVLGIAEGIETALSAHSLYKVPTWAALTAGYLEKFRAPPGVETLYIFADNDKTLTGHAAAFVCAKKNLLSSNDVTKCIIRWPQRVSDFNDVLTQGDKVLEWEGRK